MMTTPPILATGWHRRVACLVTLVLALAACSAANSPASPSASAAGTSAETSSSPAPSASPSQSVVATPSVGSVTAPLAATNQPQTIHLIEHPTNVSEVRVGSLTGCTGASGCQGDYLVGDDPMFDAATGKQVGTILFECFLVGPASGLFHCPGITIDLDGRGQIIFTEKFDGSSQTSPITGGTGEFLGATGTVTAKLPQSGNGDFVITIVR